MTGERPQPPELDEAAIQRFSRQILLSEVGGAGQVALRAQRFVLIGAGTALSTAAAYLAGAGCALSASPRAVRDSEVGFLLSASQVGAPLSASLAAALPPPACGDDHGDADGRLGELPGQSDDDAHAAAAAFETRGPRVAMGRLRDHADAGAVAYGTAGACGDCFGLALARLQGGLSGVGAVAVGSVAALVAQRLVLKLEGGVGILVVAPEGPMDLEMERCGRCR